ncbi:alpha/beta hydrolase [Pseudarthrobacter sp. NPDC058329]|uniref:alpha/beta hydrolase n=1 Tax=Pseudarthrobacter sp. NPDC058329 TaxID=3346448 RepID=UPI0036DDB9B0
MPAYDDDVTQLLATMPHRPGGLKSTGVGATRQLVESTPQPEEPRIRDVTCLAIEGPHGQIPVRLYRPPGITAPSPALVYFHGGGMMSGSVDSFDYFARRLATETRAVVASVDYRLAPEFTYPVGNDEAYAAWRWLVEGHKEFGIAAGRIGLVGDSAGGSLAASVALRARDAGGEVPAIQVLMYPGLERASSGSASLKEFADTPFLKVSDVEWMKALYLGEDESADTPDGVPSLARDLVGLPPAVVVTAEMDPLRDGAEQYAARMRDSSVPVMMMRFPGVGHGFMAQAGWINRGSQAFTWAGALTRAILST